MTRADRAEASSDITAAYDASLLKQDNVERVAALYGSLLLLLTHIEKELAVSKSTFVPAWAALRTLVRYRVAAACACHV